MTLEKIITHAMADAPADILLTNCRVLNVFTGEILDHPIAIAGDRIIGITEMPAAKIVDLGGKTVVPGFIDGHVHIESSMLSVSGFCRAVLPRGTTTVAADPHEIANVLGVAGIQYMLDSAEGQPMNVCFTLPSCVPATHMETSGADLGADILSPFLDHPRILALAEMMNYPGVIYRSPDVLAKIQAAHDKRKPVDGHAPALSGSALSAYCAAGITSDHECTDAAEAMDKMRLGMHIMVREGTCAKNLEALLPAANALTARRMMWCTDDRHPQDLMDDGHIDAIIRSAIKAGLDPVLAIQMATLNPASYFGIRDAGAIAPGYRADLVVVDDLHSLNIETVYCGGDSVAENGRMVDSVVSPEPVAAPEAMNVPLDKLDLTVPASGSHMWVIGVDGAQVVTEKCRMPVVEKDGMAVADPASDLLKMAVIERYSGNAGTGIGFVTGLGIKNGAIACSVAHDSHNIIVVGDTDSDMLLAVKAVVEMGGGLAAVSKEAVLGTLPLSVGGLMSDRPLEVVRKQLDVLLDAVHGLGARVHDPFMSLSFLALPVIPSLKLTDKGLVDIESFSVIPLFCEE